MLDSLEPLSDKWSRCSRRIIYLVYECYDALALFASQLAIKAAQSYTERLQSTQRVTEVHREDVFRHSTKLHHDVFHCNDT